MAADLPDKIPALPPHHLARQVAEAVRAAGGRAWMVGGSVRDALLDRASKDIDLEVHGLPAAELEPILRRLGPVQAVGRSFGVYKVGPGADPVDVAIPRSAKSTTSGVAGTITGDPFIGLEGACAGRDLTINAIVADPCTGEVVDPTGGVDDLAHGHLRAVRADRFGDDPLRLVRVARFAATHELSPTPELLALCRSLDASAVATERSAAELERALLRSQHPSRFFAILEQTGAWSTVFPHLAPADIHGPSVDSARALLHHVGPAPRDLATMLAAVCITAPISTAATLAHLRVHRRAGFDVRATVLAAVEQGPLLATAAADTLDTALRRAAEVVDVAVALAVALASAPDFGHAPAHQRAMELGVLHAPLAPLVFGRDLIEAGIPRGRELGRLLSEIREHQLKGAVSDPHAAVQLAMRLWTIRRTSRV